MAYWLISTPDETQLTYRMTSISAAVFLVRKSAMASNNVVRSRRSVKTSSPSKDAGAA